MLSNKAVIMIHKKLALLSKSQYGDCQMIKINLMLLKCTARKSTIIILLLTVPSCFSSCLFVVFQYFPLKLLRAKALRLTVRDTIDRFSRKFCLGQQLFNAISASHLNTILTYLEVKGETNPLWDKWPIKARGYAFSSGGWAILPSSIARDS